VEGECTGSASALVGRGIDVTITVGVTSPDGLVLAAESRSTFTENGRHRIVSDSAQKVFQVGSMGVATAGNAFIGADTIAGTMDRFIAQLDNKTSRDFDRLLGALGQFFDRAFDAHMATIKETWEPETQGYPINFLVAGYDDAGVGHLKELLIPGPKIGDYAADTRTGGSMWRGQTDVIGRLLNGVDWGQIGTPAEEPLSTEVTKRLEGLAYVMLSPITVEDAVDYATFLIRTTIDMQRFSDGTVARPGLLPACGGPIHALVVERDSARWATPSTRDHWSVAPARAGERRGP
jgi:hypothetical protein